MIKILPHFRKRNMYTLYTLFYHRNTVFMDFLFKTSLKGCFDCDLAFWLIFRRRRIFTPPHLAATSFCFSFCILTPHFFVSNRLICIVEKVENEIIIKIVALCRSNFFSFFVLESGYVNWKNLVWLSFWRTTRQVLLMLPLFLPKRFCFYLLISTKKPNSFVAVICLKVFWKRRRSIQTMLHAILCKTLPWPQSNIGRTFRNFSFCGELLEKYFQKRKLILQKKTFLSLSTVDI